MSDNSHHGGSQNYYPNNSSTGRATRQRTSEPLSGSSSIAPTQWEFAAYQSPPLPPDFICYTPALTEQSYSSSTLSGPPSTPNSAYYSADPQCLVQSPQSSQYTPQPGMNYYRQSEYTHGREVAPTGSQVSLEPTPSARGALEELFPEQFQSHNSFSAYAYTLPGTALVSAQSQAPLTMPRSDIHAPPPTTFGNAWPYDKAMLLGGNYEPSSTFIPSSPNNMPVIKMGLGGSLKTDEAGKLHIFINPMLSYPRQALPSSYVSMREATLVWLEEERQNDRLRSAVQAACRRTRAMASKGQSFKDSESHLRSVAVMLSHLFSLEAASAVRSLDFKMQFQLWRNLDVCPKGNIKPRQGGLRVPPTHTDIDQTPLKLMAHYVTPSASPNDIPEKLYESIQFGNVYL